MEIQKAAVAGTLESSDAQVTVEPGAGGVQLELSVVDKGALDCTLKARVECAVFRSCGQSAQNIPWGGVVR